MTATLSTSPAGVLADRDVLAATTAPAVPSDRAFRDTALRLALLVDRHSDTGSLRGPHAWQLLHLAGEVTAAHTAMHAEERVEHDRPCAQIASGEGCLQCVAVHADRLDDTLDQLIALLGEIAGAGA